MKRKRYDTGWHTYGIEWAPDFVRVYVDSRIKSVLDLRIRGGKSGGSAGHGWFWRAGGFPATAVNGSEVEVVVRDVWSAGGVAAPFDQGAYVLSLRCGCGWVS
jgi:hypothetical protein